MSCMFTVANSASERVRETAVHVGVPSVLHS